ncbi:hypothetical protein PG993_012566 [Apiospora rasikravindrae]|uniref:Uncharacterized protein n=1 Tax=Apiospora rasikravindrae TaxID=990691 RepID=A0ABR1S481_9PEZI
MSGEGSGSSNPTGMNEASAVPVVPLWEGESLQLESLRALLQEKCAQHAEEVAKLKEDLQKAHDNAEARLAALARKSDDKLKQHAAVYQALYAQLRKKYKAATSEQIFQEMTDERLKQKVRILRQNIKSFAMHFGCQNINECCWECCRGHIPRWSATDMERISDPDHPLVREWETVTPVSMLAYTWIILVRKVFGKFLWAGGDARGLHDVWVRLTGGGPQALRELQMWKAVTASRLLAPAHSETQVTSNVVDERQIRRKILGLWWTDFRHRLVNDFPRPQHRVLYGGHALEIIEQAVELDLEISKQGAHIEWVFDIVGRTDPGTSAEVPPSLSVVTVPALTKVGESNGDDLDKEPRP